MIVMIDNYDSFSYNVWQYLSELGADVTIFRNDEITVSDLDDLSPERVVISPGPRTPKEAGISGSVIESYFKSIPVLGICLGHQCIGQVFGGQVVPSRKIMHGKTSAIYHNGEGGFSGLSSPFLATRYNSLYSR